MKTFLAILGFLLCTFSMSAQIAEDGLPDIRSVDSIRVIKLRVNPTDTVRKIRFVTFSYARNPLSQGIDTTRGNGSLHDSLTLLSTLFARIYNENMGTAALTREAYNSMSKNKGLGEYQKMFRRIANRNYTDVTWGQFKPAFISKWNLASPSTSHTLTISETAQGNSRAQRDLPVPQGQTRFNGTLRILCENTIELVNYLGTNQVITLDAISPGVYISRDFQITLVKATQ